MHLLARYVWSAIFLVAPLRALGFVVGPTNGVSPAPARLPPPPARRIGGRRGLGAKQSAEEAEEELVALADLWRMRETMART